MLRFGRRHSKNGPNKICVRQPWKCLSRPYPFKFFKGFFPQVLLDPFLNNLFHLHYRCSNSSANQVVNYSKTNRKFTCKNYLNKDHKMLKEQCKQKTME